MRHFDSLVKVANPCLVSKTKASIEFIPQLTFIYLDLILFKFSQLWNLIIRNNYESFIANRSVLPTWSAAMYISLNKRTFLYEKRMGPLQVAIHVVQNRRTGEQKSHWDKTNKGNYHLKLCMPFVCLVPVRLLLTSRLFCTTWMVTCKGPIQSSQDYFWSTIMAAVSFCALICSPWRHVKTIYTPIARWHHFTNTTRILQGLGFCRLNVAEITKFKFKKG